MLNSNFTFSLDKINENFLVVFPILDDISFRWEKTAKADIVLEFVIQAICQFVFIKNLLDVFVIFQLVLWKAIKNSNDFIYSSRRETQVFIKVRDFVFFRFFHDYLRWINICWLVCVRIRYNIGNKFFIFFDLFYNFLSSFMHTIMWSRMTTRITLGFKVFTFHESFKFWVTAAFA